MTAATTSKHEEILIRLRDLENQCIRRNQHTESMFLNEEEQAAARTMFPESALIRYDGGYEGAQKKKVIFLTDEEDDFSDIVCIASEADQRFRTIEHRDVLGALMHLQIDRHSFGDFWVTDDHIYIYTSSAMARFLTDNLTRISRLNVSFEVIAEHPVQTFQYRKFQAVIASSRLDAVVAALAHISRGKAKEMIREGLVQIDHVTLVEPDEVCNNNCTVSIRGTGRFIYAGVVHKTRQDRIVAEFWQYI